MLRLAASSYPDAVKELVVRSRLKIENYPSTDDDSDSDSDTDTSYYECPLKVEYKDGWQYNTYTDGPDKKYYTNKAVGHDLTLEMDIEDKLDVCSEPDARATFELSPTKHVVALDNIGVNCIGDGDVTVIRGNVDGDSDMHDDEFIRVSMISVDETRRDTSVNIHSSLGTRECVIPECVIQPTLVAYGDSALCNKESLHIMRKYCFGLCGLTNQFHSTEFEWCVECVNRLIWGFLVSCVVSIVMRNRSVGTDVLSKGSDVIVSIWGLLDGLVILCDAMRECLWTLKDINDTLNNVMMGNRARIISHDIPWGEDNGQVRATRASVDISPIRVRGRFGCLGRPVQGADWLDVRPVDGGPVGTDIWIKYIGDSFSRYQSSDAAPLTEVQDIYITLHFNTECFAGLCSIRIVSFSVRSTRSLEEVIRCGGVLSLCQTMDGAALADDRSDITFTADLCVPWDAPEAVVDMNSTDLISLGPFPDKVGLVGRRKDAAMSRIMKGRDCRSVRFVVPDVHLVDRGFHDVTVVDMGDDREPTIVLQDMTRLRELWPVEVFDQMKSRQQDLELMRKSAKRNYQQVRPMPCRFCGKVIRVDMYRHVARLHLDLVQLWRCPIAWCTTWKGSPQDCLEHVRSGHDAPWVERTASIERYAPPWTVSRQLWMDSLRIEHSGISTDMLLFSEVGMPLTQHYRVYKGGLPHASTIGVGHLGHNRRHSRECRFRKFNKVRWQFHNGRLHIVIINRPTLYIRSTVGSSLFGRHNRPLRLGRFRIISKVRIRFSDGRLRALPKCWSALFICSAVGAGLLGHLRRNLHQFHVPVVIHVHGQFPEIHLLSVLRDGGPKCPPPPWIVGSSILSDPRGEPLPSDQSSFSARRRSVAIFGDIIK